MVLEGASNSGHWEAERSEDKLCGGTSRSQSPSPTLGRWEAAPCPSHGVSRAQWRGALSPGAELTSTDVRESTQFKEVPEWEQVSSHTVPQLSACQALPASPRDHRLGWPGRLGCLSSCFLTCSCSRDSGQRFLPL